MKKIFWGFAALPLLALLATSCGKESVDSSSDLERVLAFKAATGKQTLSRASEANLGTLQGDGLKVYSYNAGNGVFYREFDLQYSSGNSEWSYGTPIFHPIKFDLNHYSVYPMTNIVPSFPASTTFDYVIADTDYAQEDLMVASATSNHLDGLANLVYRHVLSQVNFAIQGVQDLKVEISDIKVVGVKNTGTFNFNGGTWALLGTVANYDYVPANGNVTNGTNDILYLGNEGNGRNNGYDNALMLMPQSFTPGDGAGFTFHYMLTNAAGDEEVDYGDLTVNFNDLSVTEWEQGRRYLYNIIFDPILLKFNVDIMEGWIDYNGSDGIVDVDMN